MAEVLIVDDERVLREGLKAMLQGEGLDVRTAKDGEDALRKIAEKSPDLVLLDVMMPKLNGFRCCEEIRKREALLPVIFLTAKDAETDQVRGLGLGADDYIKKNASEAVLLARINRALDRIRQADKAHCTSNGPSIRLGAVTVDLKNLAVSEHGTQIAVLTKTEADILRILYAHAGERIVPDDLIAELRGKGYSCEDSLVYTYVYRLRRKLGTAGERIVNMRGTGYILTR